MASTTTSIPRFLLPQSGLIWRRAVRVPLPARVRSRTPSSSPTPNRIFLRLASSSSSDSSSNDKANTLAKPERFNPPSHGSRLPRGTPPRHYGGELNYQEAKAQASRDYPGLPPPRNSIAHWFLNNRWIHVVITVGTLTGLSIYTFAINFQRSSPFAHMLPAATDYIWHPISSIQMLAEVTRLHEGHKAERIYEKRQRSVDDVGKRAAYRRAHGLPEEMGLFNQPMAKIRRDGEPVQGQGEGDMVVQEGGKETRRKWLGIF
ncbi:uncharacterized protein C8A04DRAFT_37857 [Dichotomopilus funicola]|uniref:Uncharacterized protein n=1 Tax=Dichotomopilus funicola TaxID=1934379 RepID=A0AAN6ZMV7_9PEZI|nr:hypothetical protein C8A04DRAFT_37857 [Dichotomopilus funicola]